MSSIDTLRAEVREHGIQIPDDTWTELASRLAPATFKKKATLISQTEVCEHVYYVTGGILASEYVVDDKSIISRFFRKGNFCTNLISAYKRTLAYDNIIALTDVEVVAMPYRWIMDQYLNGADFGRFIRMKFLGNLIEAKNFITIKTFSDTEMKYRFLLDEYPDVVQDVPNKHLAAFLGITPEGLSRFLNGRRKKLNPGQ